MKFKLLLLSTCVQFTSSLSIPQRLSESVIEQSLQQVFSWNLFEFFSPNNKNNGEIKSDLEAWIDREKIFALKSILNNVEGTSDFLSDGIAKGVIIASPSKEYPNYFFQWARDSALTMKTLLLYLDDNKFQDEKLSEVIASSIENQYHIQRLSNKSGRFDDEDRSGLGEPKFLVNSSVFDDSWGRPQRDGPGLRAISFIMYLNLLDKYGKQLSNDFLISPEFVYKEMIKPDLQYVVKNWKKEGFDLWEEIQGIHLFTSLTQLRALKDGIKFASSIDKEDTPFIEDMKKTFFQLKDFIEGSAGYSSLYKGHLVETPKLVASGERSGLDAAILLASIHSHNYEYDDYSDIPFDVDNYKLLNSLNALVGDMKIRYPLNRKSYHDGGGAAIGRYPEDVYDGYAKSEGNPWFISTASAAELIYKYIYKLVENRNDILIDESNLEFFEQFLNIGTSFEPITITYGSPRFDELLRKLWLYSDSFLEIVKEHTDIEGHMSEQFNKYTGYMQGAHDLSWSYSAAWNAFRWRSKTIDLINH